MLSHPVRRRTARRTIAALAIACCFVAATLLRASDAASAGSDIRPHAGMLRYPDISQNHISFIYASDIWIIPREGGVAVPLASPPGSEAFPKFSPDGQTI